MSHADRAMQEMIAAELAWWTAPSKLLDAAVVAESMLQSAEESIDPRELRNALGRFATGVCVVTTRTGGGEMAGLTVNSFSSVSLTPPLVAWCLGRKAPSLRSFSEAERFAVHVLGADQHALAMHFARPSQDKFAAVRNDIEPGLADVPVFKNALARFECRKASVLDGGDHVIFLGRVERFAYTDRPPLLFHAGRFLERGAEAS